MVIGRTETVDLPPLLGKRLDDADARDRVGQHARHLGPGDVGAAETPLEPAAHQIDEPHDERKGDKRDQREHGIEPDEHSSGEEHQEAVGEESDEVDREEVVDLVGVVTDPRDQVAGPFDGKEIERQ